MIETVILKRCDQGDQGTFGQLVTPRGYRCFTGELPDRDNQSNISRIPAGLYRVEATWSPRFKRRMYLLFNVPRRAGIRKHPANFMGDKTKNYRCQLNGCIALGERLGVMGGQKALLVSAPAVRRFEQHMNLQPFILQIIDKEKPNA